MRSNTVRGVIDTGDVAVNAWLSGDSAYVAEAVSHAGFDSVTVDLQHGMFGTDSAVRLLQAVSSGPATPMARCTSSDPAQIGKLLDAGAYGVICPAIDDADSCADFVASCRYPPHGRRSYGPARGLLYGGADYVTEADRTVLTWAMVESRQALDNLDEIVNVDGLDGIYVGPNDLALSLGERPGQISPTVLKALHKVADTVRGAGRYVGGFCADESEALQLVEAGFHLVTPGNDIGLLRDAATRRIAAVRGGAGTSRIAAGGY
ncbi:HpcH/HpaI aldolase/citrate lyase family protein [Streptomyces sp. NPDC102364]|uniref:HpcH/HpaI aldolase family protein n=1 Tax=Streptomyces sp. NPDC102364 TaxID=3366161 RepID=UPI00381C1832